MKRVIVTMFSLLLILSACSSKTEQKVNSQGEKSDKQEVTTKTEELKENVENEANQENSKKKNTVVIEFGDTAGDKPYTQNDSSELLYTDENSITLHGYSQVGNQVLANTGDTEGVLADDGPILATSKFSEGFGSLFLKKNNYVLNVMEITEAGEIEANQLDINTEKVKSFSAEFNLLFLTYFEAESSDELSKGFFRKGNDPKATWNEIKLPKVDSNIIAMKDKGYYVSIKEKAIMSVDLKGNTRKVAELQGLEKNLKNGDLSMQPDGTWAVLYMDQETSKGIIETPSVMIEFNEPFNGIDFLNKDYFVTTAGVAPLLMNANTGAYLHIIEEEN